MTIERTFDRLPQFDTRSLAFPIRALLEAKPKFRSYTWRCDQYNDQGSEGACVGFAWSHELAARPVEVKQVNENWALGIYARARFLDEWPGEDYDGTSVIAGAKAVKEQGYISEYRWAFGLDDLRLAVGYKGPAVLGLNWYGGMYEPDGYGFIYPDGGLLGGHAILCVGVSEKRKCFRLHNSWGPSWGHGGDCFISFDHMNQLLHEQGEACIPVVRSKG